MENKLKVGMVFENELKTKTYEIVRISNKFSVIYGKNLKTAEIKAFWWFNALVKYVAGKSEAMGEIKEVN